MSDSAPTTLTCPCGAPALTRREYADPRKGWAVLTAQYTHADRPPCDLLIRPLFDWLTS